MERLEDGIKEKNKTDAAIDDKIRYYSGGPLTDLLMKIQVPSNMQGVSGISGHFCLFPFLPFGLRTFVQLGPSPNPKLWTKAER